jgi:hypothetical protein
MDRIKYAMGLYTLQYAKPNQSKRQTLHKDPILQKTPLVKKDPLHRKKKVREFPVPSRDVTTKLSLGGNNDVIPALFLPRGSLVSDIPAGNGKLGNLFLRCTFPIKNPYVTK